MREIISLVLGYLSILIWIQAQIPQLFLNYRRKTTDGLSLPFLLLWLTGDVTNLVGSILTAQLPFQIMYVH